MLTFLLLPIADMTSRFYCIPLCSWFFYATLFHSIKFLLMTHCFSENFPPKFRTSYSVMQFNSSSTTNFPQNTFSGFNKYFFLFSAKKYFSVSASLSTINYRMKMNPIRPACWWERSRQTRRSLHSGLSISLSHSPDDVMNIYLRYTRKYFLIFGNIITFSILICKLFSNSNLSFIKSCEITADQRKQKTFLHWK